MNDLWLFALLCFGVYCLCHKVKTLNHILVRLLFVLFFKKQQNGTAHLRQQIIILSFVIYICKMPERLLNLTLLLCLQSDFFSVVRSMSLLWLLIKRIRILVLLLLCNSSVAYSLPIFHPIRIMDVFIPYVCFLCSLYQNDFLHAHIASHLK